MDITLLVGFVGAGCVGFILRSVMKTKNKEENHFYLN